MEIKISIQHSFGSGSCLMVIFQIHLIFYLLECVIIWAPGAVQIRCTLCVQWLKSIIIYLFTLPRGAKTASPCLCLDISCTQKERISPAVVMKLFKVVYYCSVIQVMAGGETGKLSCQIVESIITSYGNGSKQTLPCHTY